MSEPAPSEAPPAEDPGQALEEAVGLALRVLQAITLVLLLSFLGSGIFTVESNEVAFLRRAGIQNSTPLGPGLHWRWQVVDEVVRIKKTVEEVEIETFDLRKTKDALDGEESRQRAGLDPEHDGYLVCGDEGLVHVSLALRYAPRSPFLRFRNRVRPEDRDRFLRVLCERAAVRAAAGREVEALLGAGKAEFLGDVQGGTQAALDTLEAGVEVKGVDLEGDLRASPQVRAAFAQVTAFSQQVDRIRSKARQEATRIENEGSSQAAQIARDAGSEAMRIRSEAAALAEEFEAYLPEFRRDPRGLRQRLLAETLADAMAEVGESFLVGDGQLRIKLERDTRAKRSALKDRARERLGLEDE